MTSDSYDLIIRGGTVIDGTKAPRFDADIGVRDGRIAAITDLRRLPECIARPAIVVQCCSAGKALYVTHMRDESDRVMEALEETFHIGRELGVPVVVHGARYRVFNLSCLIST